MNPPRDLNFRVTPNHQMNYSRPNQVAGHANAPQANYYNYPINSYPQMQTHQSYTPAHQAEIPYSGPISSSQGAFYHPTSMHPDSSPPASHMHQAGMNYHGQAMNYHPQQHQSAHQSPQSYPYHGKPSNDQVRPAVTHPPAYNYPAQSQPNQTQAPQPQLSYPHAGSYPYSFNSNRQNVYPANPYPHSTMGNYQLSRPNITQEKPFQTQPTALTQPSHHLPPPSTLNYPGVQHDASRTQHQHHQPHQHHQLQQMDRHPQKLPQQSGYHPHDGTHASNMTFSHQTSQAHPISQSLNTHPPHNSPSPIKQSYQTSESPTASSGATHLPGNQETPRPVAHFSSKTIPGPPSNEIKGDPGQSKIEPAHPLTRVMSDNPATDVNDNKAMSSTSSPATPVTPSKSPSKQQLSIPSQEEQMDVDFIRRMMMPSAKERSSSLLTNPSTSDKSNEKSDVKSNEKVDSPLSKKVTESLNKSAEKSRQRKQSVSAVEKLRKSFSANSPNSRTSDMSSKKSVPSGVTVASRSMKGGKHRRKMVNLDDSSLLSDEAGETETLASYENLIEYEEYNPPSKLNPLINRSMPPVSEEHRKLINRLRDSNIIEDDSLYKLMMSLDMKLFYEKISPEWAEHEAVCLERTIKHIQPGHSILVFPYNTYFSVALAVYVGTGGRVVAFGHQGNAFALRSNGLSWLLDDYRIRFTNNTVALYYGYPDYNTYLECGFPKAAPFDLVVLTDQEITKEIRSQSKIGGLFIRPDEENLFFVNEPVESSNDPYNTETETESETECEDN